MKKNMVYILLVISLFACETAFEEQKTVYYVIKEPVVDLSNSTPPPPPALFYGQYNFILASDGRTYYHNRYNNYGWCGTGVDASKPGFLSLQPSDLVELTDDNLTQFVRSAIRDSSSYHRRVAAIIASSTDTITSQHFKEIIGVFRQESFNVYTIRKTTEEEQVVLKHKIENKEYNPEQINWEAGFGGIKFLPPKVEE